MAEEEQDDALTGIPADRGLVEALYTNGRITKEARDYALALLYPRREWGLWTARLLLALGAALVLAGVIYFFAFNWAKIPPAVKLAAIEIALIGCLAGACYYSLKKLSGQIWLLAASVLVGVFLAVFGQIYQTGADAWQLFALWSVLVLGWASISAFAAHWLLWLALANVSLWLWWEQAAVPGWEMKNLIFIWLTLLNGAALALREYFTLCKGYTCLAARWTRLLLTVAILAIMLQPMLTWMSWIIAHPNWVTLSMMLAGVVGVIGHITLYYLYRHRLADFWSLAATVLSACIVLDYIVIYILAFEYRLSPFLVYIDDIVLDLSLLAGLLTIILFTAGGLYLKHAARQMEAGHA